MIGVIHSSLGMVYSLSLNILFWDFMQPIILEIIISLTVRGLVISHLKHTDLLFTDGKGYKDFIF